MVKGIKFLRAFLFSATLILLCFLIYGFYFVPDEFYSVSGKIESVNEIYYVSYNEDEAKEISADEEERYSVEISFLNVVPVKNSFLTVSSRKYVAVSGELFGLRLYTDGVIIVDTDEVDTETGYVSPSKQAGLEKGDIIYSVDSQRTETSSTVSQIFVASQGKPLKVEYVRNGKHYTTTLSLAYSQSEQKYKAGLWIRDSAAGIGTMTFYDTQTGVFAGLGHGVCDVDTGELLPLSQGDIVSAYVNGCYKGKYGQAGELCGVFNSGSNGTLVVNCETGVYGICDEVSSENILPVSCSYEVKTGYAQIISTVDDSGPQYYDIEITKISSSDSQSKNITIKVTDSKLIEKTGGIVQGMSGSPIIQNGMLVGAVTHVFINDPTQGYAIFAETMLEKAESIS